MAEETAPAPVRAPWHLWLIGILALLWNSVGAFDYLMTQTENEGYMGRFSPEQLEFFYGFPAWVVAFWAIAVWGSLLGSILLLLRKRFAVEVFLVAFLAMVVTAIRNYVFAGGMEVSGGVGTLAFTLMIFLFALFLWRYAHAMRSRGVLT
jgi:small basic protein